MYRPCTKRPKWRYGYGSVAPQWDTRDDGSAVLRIPKRAHSRYVGGHDEKRIYGGGKRFGIDTRVVRGFCCDWCSFSVPFPNLKRKEAAAMAVSKNWDKAPAAGSNNRVSRAKILQGQPPLRVIEKRDDEEELEGVSIIAPRNMGIKLLGALDGLIRKYQAIPVPVKFGFEQESGDVYLMTLKVETVPTSVLRSARVF